MFKFRLITLADGNQVIDRSISTLYEALTPLQMMEYIEVDDNIAYAERMEKKRRKEAKKNMSFSYKFKMAQEQLTK